MTKMLSVASLSAIAVCLALPAPAFAQDHDHGAAPPEEEASPPSTDHSHMDHDGAEHSEMDHSRMDHGSMDHSEMDHGRDQATPGMSAEGSGTARLPGNEGGGHGLHLATGDWMVMTHGFASVQYTDHGGPRGDDKLYSTSMLMLMAEHQPDWGRIQLKSMFSLEPTMNADGYPNLFATGETAGGEPLVDRQHPHDFFMELAVRIDVNIAEETSLFLYGGPVGEPAIGPSAFMHRGSARLNPEPPITHHWFDSTHITYGVVTAGVSSRRFQLEASAFRGAEPDEERWGIETPKLDSWSVRGTWTPLSAWALQASYAEIEEPEAVHPGEDERRFTASAHYAGVNGLSAMAAFSSKTRLAPGEDNATLTAWLAEANYDFAERHTIFGRFENVLNDELFPDHHDPLHDAPFRVSKFQAGYAYSLPLGDAFSLALGGSLAAYAKPEALDAVYGENPLGYTLFTRLTLGR